MAGKSKVLNYLVKPLHWEEKKGSETCRNIYYGLVLGSEIADSPDTAIKLKHIALTAHYFLSHYEGVITPPGCAVVESYIVPLQNMKVGTMGVDKGSWVMAFEIKNEDLWREINGDRFSGINVSLAVPEELVC